MKHAPVRLDTLLIVGYCDYQVPNDLLPKVVPPIYQSKVDVTEPLFYPPFECSVDGILLESFRITREKFSELLALQLATEIPPVDAQQASLLWIDQNGTVQYGFDANVGLKLWGLSRQYLLKAKELLAMGDWDIAEQLAQRAINSDMHAVEAPIIMLHIENLRQRSDHAAIIRDNILKMDERHDVDALLLKLQDELEKKN